MKGDREKEINSGNKPVAKYNDSAGEKRVALTLED